MKPIIPEPAKPKSLKKELFSAFDLSIDSLLGATQARNQFKVDGAGLTVAVLDTGLRVTHECFTDRVIPGINFTENGDHDDVADYHGHGTNVAGIISAGTNDERRGIAPGASIIPLKVIPAYSLAPIQSALDWILKNYYKHNISVVNLSLGIPGTNFQNDNSVKQEFKELHNTIKKLNKLKIAVVAAAGNDYFNHQQEGMSVPAIFRESISVGAVYDSSVGMRKYLDGAIAYSTHSDQITPFTQRLSKETSPDCYTDVFSAGASATSAGNKDDTDTSTQDGTSQAAPTVSGVILLLQEHYLKLTGELPKIELLQDVLRSTSTWILDTESTDDNVKNSEKNFPRINALQSLVALDKHIKLNSPES